MAETLPIHLSANQLYALVEHVNPEEQMELVRRLDELVWGKRLDALLRRLDERLEERPISEAEILREVEAVREANYAKSRG